MMKQKIRVLFFAHVILLSLPFLGCRDRHGGQSDTSALAFDADDLIYELRLEQQGQPFEANNPKTLQDFANADIVLYSKSLKPGSEGQWENVGFRLFEQYRRILQRGDLADDFAEIRDFIVRLKITDKDLFKILGAIDDATAHPSIHIKLKSGGYLDVSDASLKTQEFSVAILPFLNLKHPLLALTQDVSGRFDSKHRSEEARKITEAALAKNPAFKGYVFQKAQVSILVYRVYFSIPNSSNQVYFNFWKDSQVVTGPYPEVKR